MNDLGDVVGWADLPDGSSAPFVWFYATGTMHNLNDFVDPASGWTIGDVQGINNYGQICGSAYKVPVSGGAAIRLDPPAAGAQYGTLVFVSSDVSNAWGINDHGDVVGSDDSVNNTTGNVFIYTDELGPHMVSGIADGDWRSSVSNRETATDPTSAYIAGSSWFGTAEHAVRYTPGVGVVDLGTLGKSFPNSYTYGVNDSGQVAGVSNAGGGFQVFRYTNNVGMKSLGSWTTGWPDINNSGDVVANGSFPFIYMDAYGTIDVRKLTTNISPTTAALTLWSVNNGRDIAGQYNGVACILEVTHP
jgi:hypothetical protein